MPLITDDDIGIVTPKPTPDVGAVVTTVPIVDDAYRTIAQDTKTTPAHTLMPMIDGSNWTVDYFAQVLTTDSPLIQQGGTNSGTIQQYKRIEQLDLRVTTPLSTQQDTETKTMVVEGRAVVYAGFIPNENDCFVAAIGLGAPATLKVMTTEKMSFMGNAAYEISYRVMSQDQAVLDDLISKTVQTFVYQKDNIAYGQSPMVEQAQVAVLDEIGVVVDTLVSNYMGEFFRKDVRTFVTPLQEYRVYDPFLIEFLEHVLRVGETPLLQTRLSISTSEDVVFAQNNIWTALLENNPELVTAGFTRTGVAACALFSGHPTNRGLRWSGMTYTVYPLNPKIGYAGLTELGLKTLYDFEYVSDATIPRFYPRQNHAVADNDASQTATPVNTTRVLFDDYYVFSEKFYTKNPTMDAFEKEVWACLNGQALDGEQLIRSAKLVPTWGAMERFYHTPVLIHLLRKHIRSYQNWSL